MEIIEGLFKNLKAASRRDKKGQFFSLDKIYRKGTSDLSNPCVYSIFKLLLIEQTFEKKKLIIKNSLRKPDTILA